MATKWFGLVVFAVLAQGQTAFSEASVSAITSPVWAASGFASAGPRADYRGFTIPMLAAEAWKVRLDEIAVETDVPSGPYEVTGSAAADSAPTRDEFRTMLHSLLATRFKMAAHLERREKYVYELVDDGSKLRPSSGSGPCRQVTHQTLKTQTIVATNCPIQAVIGHLFLSRPVYDGTGLTGSYDFEMTLAVSAWNNDPYAITPFDAARELGLRLQGEQRFVDTLVIDHVEQPTGN